MKSKIKTKKSNKVIIVSLITNIIFIFVIVSIGYKYIKFKQYSVNADITRVKVMASDFNMLSKTEKNKIVFLGDSLTEYNKWDEMFNTDSIVNRGIGGNTTNDILNRLNDVTIIKPKKLFLMAGINDLLQNKNNDELITNYKKIVSNIKNKTPNTQIYIESMLPVNNDNNDTKISNKTIISINYKLKGIAKDNNATYIDLFDLFIDNGKLKQNLTVDGIHLTGQGYKIWEQAIEKYVNE